MAAAKITLREKMEAPEAEAEVHSQRKRPNPHRYLLQVDRQTKSSFPTEEGAEAAGMVIKTKFPIVRVSVYDAEKWVNKILELPKG
jgi:hypothetical protein